MSHHSKRQELAGQRRKSSVWPFHAGIEGHPQRHHPRGHEREDLTRQRKSQELLAVWWPPWAA